MFLPCRPNYVTRSPRRDIRRDCSYWTDCEPYLVFDRDVQWVCRILTSERSLKSRLALSDDETIVVRPAITVCTSQVFTSYIWLVKLSEEKVLPLNFICKLQYLNSTGIWTRNCRPRPTHNYVMCYKLRPSANWQMIGLPKDRKERSFIQVSSRSSAWALIEDTVNRK